MSLLRIHAPDDYIAHLEKNPAELAKLHNDLLIHVTRFFREPESFDALARDVLPTLDTTGTRQSARGWRGVRRAKKRIRLPWCFTRCSRIT